MAVAPGCRAELPATAGIAYIALKYLQNPRICHVLTSLAKKPGAMLYSAGVFQSAEASGTVSTADVLLRMERALKHKFTVGETVYFTASNVARPAASGTYEVIRLLPTDGDDCQYRIKSSTEAFERVAKESQLDIS